MSLYFITSLLCTLSMTQASQKYHGLVSWSLLVPELCCHWGKEIVNINVMEMDQKWYMARLKLATMHTRLNWCKCFQYRNVMIIQYAKSFPEMNNISIDLMTYNFHQLEGFTFTCCGEASSWPTPSSKERTAYTEPGSMAKWHQNVPKHCQFYSLCHPSKSVGSRA